MSKLELMLSILGVNFNQVFMILDSNNDEVGTYAVELLPNGCFNLRMQSPKTGTWCMKPDSRLGSILVSVIKKQCKIKPLNYNMEKKFSPIKFEKPDNAKDYPIYITNVTVNKEDDYYLNVQYINHLGYNKTRILKCYMNKKGELYCYFGLKASKLYINYKGPVLLANVPEEDKPMLNKIISQYGSVIL